eukprot:TRINITY_DN4894_c0_g1_i1.p1 TRINITY_DN4894_c0_g1~~TRINITY_DN4894_c0_g1_i1.p1  ORF type:complete len:864 (+),score=237.62 TRINITY_DN4894_c0_g1_i1:62-2593(+)
MQLALRLAWLAAAAAAARGGGSGTTIITRFQFATEAELVPEPGSPYRRFTPAAMTHWANVTIRDRSAAPEVQHSFARSGFEYISLSPPVRNALAAVDRGGLDAAGITFNDGRGHVEGKGTVHYSLDAARKGLGADAAGESNGARLARALGGASAYRLAGLYHYNLFCGGFVIRASLPGGRNATGMNGPAMGVHIDQDCQGEPLRTQMAGGWLPVAFRWFPWLQLTSLWLPVRRPNVRPIAVLDTTTFDRGNHQVHYTDWKNQRFFAVHDDSQEWWFDSGMGFGDGVTWGLCDLPHASFSLQGEDELARLRGELVALEPALAPGSQAAAGPLCGADAAAAAAAAAQRAAAASPSLGPVSAQVLAARRAACAQLLGGPQSGAADAVAAALHATVRKSVEARCLTLVVPQTTAWVAAVVTALALAAATAALCWRRTPRARGRPIPQPLPVRIFNALPLPRRRLDPAALTVAATKAEGGLSDFGEPPLEPALGVLCRSINEEAHLSNLGAIAARTDRLIANLRCRLRAQELRRAHPEIAERPITAPVIIAGLPRSGTTMLQRLLAADPRFRMLRTWEAGNPAPFRGSAPAGEDPRIKYARRAERAIKYLAPAFQAAHAFEAEGVEEEVMLLDLGSFLSPCSEATYRCPSWAAWRKGADNRPGYAAMRRMLQLLDWQQPGERWLLKTPHHLWYLGELFAEFPDAKVIITHRHPSAVVPSMCKLIKASRSVMSTYCHDAELGQEWCANVAGQCSAAAAFRAAHRERASAILDVGYHSLMDNTTAELRRIYHFIGWELPPQIEELLVQTQSARPQHAHGRHDYGLAEFGLSTESICRDFAEYTAAYADYL